MDITQIDRSGSFGAASPQGAQFDASLCGRDASGAAPQAPSSSGTQAAYVADPAIIYAPEYDDGYGSDFSPEELALMDEWVAENGFVPEEGTDAWYDMVDYATYYAGGGDSYAYDDGYAYDDAGDFADYTAEDAIIDFASALPDILAGNYYA
jgi:hypothetical protein